MKTLLAIATITAATSAQATLIYHDTATTDGGQFNANFGVENLNNAGFTSPSDTENASDTAFAKSYATSNPPVAGYPVTITLNFSAPADLNEFYLWNHAHNSAAGATNQGVKDFSLTFFDDENAAGSQIGVTFTDSASKAAASGAFAAQQFDLLGTYENVRSVVLTAGNHNSPAAKFIGIRELAFNTIPEPASISLLCLGALTLIRRR